MNDDFGKYNKSNNFNFKSVKKENIFNFESNIYGFAKLYKLILNNMIDATSILKLKTYSLLRAINKIDFENILSTKAQKKILTDKNISDNKTSLFLKNEKQIFDLINNLDLKSIFLAKTQKHLDVIISKICYGSGQINNSTKLQEHDNLLLDGIDSHTLYELEHGNYEKIFALNLIIYELLKTKNIIETDTKLILQIQKNIANINTIDTKAISFIRSQKNIIGVSSTDIKLNHILRSCKFFDCETAMDVKVDSVFRSYKDIDNIILTDIKTSSLLKTQKNFELLSKNDLKSGFKPSLEKYLKTITTKIDSMINLVSIGSSKNILVTNLNNIKVAFISSSIKNIEIANKTDSLSKISLVVIRLYKLQDIDNSKLGSLDSLTLAELDYQTII